MARAEIPYDCNECPAFDENPAAHVREVICPMCAWQKDFHDPVVFKLLDCIEMQDNGCPLQRHELTNTEWKALGHLRRARDAYWKEVEEKKRKEAGGD